jgi:class 3 adenylate cyclase
MGAFRGRLTVKITIVIVLVLIIGFGVSTILTIRRESQLLVEQNKVAARQLIGTLVASIETAMLQERPDITRGLVEDLRSSNLVQGLVIYRRNGVEAFTDLATLREVSKEAELPKGVMASIEKMRREPGRPMVGPLFTRALETLQTQEALESRDGAAVFTVYQPIPNRERCQGCHGTDHKVRAVIQAATSMEPVMVEVRRQRNRQIMIAVLTILAAAAVLAVAMRYVVVRPIHALAAVARRIGEGDFTARAPAGSSDEVGELGSALNDMTGHLARAREDLAARNTELAAVKALLERDPSATSLEKRNEEVSVLFLDIAGYTRLSEQLAAKRLNQLVQTYFSSFLEIIRAQHGDVNETAGDGLMVIFQRRHGEGSREEDHALNATRAAFAIRQKTVALNEEYAGVFPAIALHMGINTGQALVGATKLGGAGSQRWTFTATGPTTNLAARFAGSAEGGDIVVGPVTAERIASVFVLEALGERSFKNVSQPLAVYRVIPPGVYSKVT